MALRIASSVAVTGRSAVASPSASSVVVSTPRRAEPSYVFGSPPRNRSSRVARPTPRMSSPVAMGSSVPACPTLRVPSVRRTTSTTSCDVIPPGLSTSSRPSGFTSQGRNRRRCSQRGDQPRDRARRAVLRGVAGRQPVSAAAEGGGDRGQVVLAARPGADLEPPVGPLLEDGRDVHVADRADEVDQVVGLLRADTGVGQVGLRQVRPDEVDVRVDRGPGQRDRLDAQVLAPVVLVQRLHHARVIERMLAERGGDPERLGRGRLVLEAAGVRDESGVQAGGGLVGHPAAHRLDQPEHHLARGRCGRVDQRDRPQPVVRTVMVDPDDLTGVRRRGSERARAGRTTRSRT